MSVRRDLNKCLSHSLYPHPQAYDRIYTLAALEARRLEKEKQGEREGKN